MPGDIAGAIATLRDIGAAVEYGWDQPLNERDTRLDSLMMDITKSGPADVASIRGELGPNEVRVLGIYSRRAAGRAIEGSSEELVRMGLTAVVLALYGDEGDPRDLMISLAPLHVAASAVAVDPGGTFDRVAERAPQHLADTLRAFAKRQDVTLGLFGWQEVLTPTGTWISSK